MQIEETYGKYMWIMSIQNWVIDATYSFYDIVLKCMCDYTDCMCQVFSMLVFCCHLTSYFILIIPPTFVSVHRSWTKKTLWILGHINASKPVNEWLLDKLAENVKAWPATENTSDFPQMVVIVREMGPLISGKSRLVNYYNLSRIDELKNDFEWLLKNTFSYKWVIFSVWTVRGTNWRHAI